MTRSRSSRKQMPETITPEQATAILKQAEQDRINTCGDEIEIVLRKHECIMEPQIIIRGTTIFAQMIILSNPTPNQSSQMKKIAEMESTRIAAQEEVSDEELEE